MAVMDEFKEEREALKKGTLKQRFNYFWDYYKWHVIISIFAALLIGSFIYQLATNKEVVFNAILLNANLQDEHDTYSQEYAEYAGIDLTKNSVLFDSTIYTLGHVSDEATSTASQKLLALTSSGAVDVMISDTSSIQPYANSEMFYDLRNILTEEQIATYEPYFYYVDQKTLDEIAAANNAFDFDFVPTYPDPSKPEEMTEPIPVGIYLDECEILLEKYHFMQENNPDIRVVLGVYSNSEQLDNTLKFIDFIFEE